jgi:predicted N-formylglutamate amidohydrolase
VSFLAVQSGDSRLVATHWSFDAGAEEFTRELSKRLPSVAVLARFSRLLCDANRPIGSETMFRKEAEGKPILLNQNLTEGQFAKGSALHFCCCMQSGTASSCRVFVLIVFAAWCPAEIQRRLDTLYHPFHRILKRVADVVKPRLVLAIHSFSPEYEGQKRDIEIGVLVKHEKDRALADKFVEAYAKIGVRVAINEPWSAMDGYAFTANSFNSVRCASIMLEFRQDLAVQAAWALKVTQATIDVLREAGHQ